MDSNDIDNRFLLRYIDVFDHDMVFNVSIYGVLFEVYIENTFFTNAPRSRFAVNHSHAYHEICLFAQGESVLHVENQSFPVTKYSVSYTPRFAQHHLAIQGQSYVLPYYIHFLFDERELEKAIGRPFKPKPFVLQNAQPLFLYLEKIQSEYKSHAFNNKDYIRCLFVLLLTEIVRVLIPNYKEVPDPTDQKQLQTEESELRLIYMIGAFFEYNYAKDIRMEDLAEKFNISPRHFDRIMKKHFDMSYKKRLSLTRIQVAMHLLKNTDESVSSIAEKVGYNSLNTFQRAFYQIAGASPSIYRKQSKNGHDLP